MNKIKLLKLSKSAIRDEIGWCWPFFIIKCFFKKKSAFKKTHWATLKNEESKLMESLSLEVVFYQELKKKTNKEKALNMMRKIIIPFALAQVDELLHPIRISYKEPMKVLIEYLKKVDNEGSGRFAIRDQKNDNNRCHRIVKKCPFHDFFVETGVPELTQLFCETDIEFYTKRFPEFVFHRNGSWQNTIAYGKDECEFVFEKNNNRRINNQFLRLTADKREIKDSPKLPPACAVGTADKPATSFIRKTLSEIPSEVRK